MTTEDPADLGLLFQYVAADPWGFLGRVLQQTLEQAGEGMAAGHGDRPPEEMMATALSTWLTRLMGYGGDARAQDEELRARNEALAAALGACGCWGALPGCQVCGGAGEPGWVLPDRDLFASYVHPALQTVARHRAVAAKTVRPMNGFGDDKRDNERKENADG